MEKISISKRWSLKQRDFLKGLLMSVLVPVLVVIQEAFEKDFEITWNTLGKVAVAAILGYLLKNLNDKPKVIIEATTNAQAEKIKENLE